MAKIRTIKPEFWESEQVGECHPMARLLFICLLNFCDDGGNYPASVKAMKRNAFGYDEVTYSQVDAWMQELITNGLVVTYDADGKAYWHVTGFSKHQTIGRPFYKYPSFTTQTMPEQCSDNVQTLHEQCSNNTQTMPEQCSSIAGNGNGKETERKGEGNIQTPSVVVPPAEPPNPVVGLLVQSGVCRNPHDPKILGLVRNGVPYETVKEAVGIAKRKNALNIGFVVGVIENWQRQADGMKAGNTTRPPGKKKSLEEAIADRHAVGEIVDGEVREVVNGLTC